MTDATGTDEIALRKSPCSYFAELTIGNNIDFALGAVVGSRAYHINLTQRYGVEFTVSGRGLTNKVALDAVEYNQFGDNGEVTFVPTSHQSQEQYGPSKGNGRGRLEDSSPCEEVVTINLP